MPEDVDPWEAPAAVDGRETPGLTDTIRATAEDIADAADRAARAAQFGPTPAGPSPADRAAAAAERGALAAAAARVAGTETRAIAVHERTPSAALRDAARRLTTDLRRAQYRDVARTRVASVAPPGRMRMGEIMRRQAQRDARVRITAAPFQQTRRREVPNPPLTVAFSGDVSGSMGEWQAVTADLSWALATAVTHLDGTVAAAAWNEQAAFTLPPGVAPAAVHEALCGGGSGGCAVSLDALDGALGLTHGTGARLCVVVTDGAIGGTPQIDAVVDRMLRAGVRVLWVLTAAGGWSPRGCTPVVLADPSQFAGTVGAAVVDVLRTT